LTLNEKSLFPAYYSACGGAGMFVGALSSLTSGAFNGIFVGRVFADGLREKEYVVSSTYGDEYSYLIN
jgi:hypothetical protein